MQGRKCQVQRFCIFVEIQTQKNSQALLRNNTAWPSAIHFNHCSKKIQFIKSNRKIEAGLFLTVSIENHLIYVRSMIPTPL